MCLFDRWLVTLITAVITAVLLFAAPWCFAEAVVPAIIDQPQASQTQQSPIQDQSQPPPQSQPIQQPTQQPQPAQQTQPVQPPVSPGSGGTAGIRPVSPDEFTGRISGLIDRAYAATSPVTDALAKIMLGLSGIVAIFVLFTGMALFKRVFGAMLAIGLGLFLYYGAPYIVGLVKGITAYTTGA